ncbi:MAG: class I SAM-dependent methyltransferase [Actinomycetota bacterium]|nr:class I SAM-dependent methyltransferase [Actinomycetota bacterium]
MNGSHRREVAQRYATDPEAYRDLFGPALLQLTTRLLQELPLSDARRVADVAAGAGLLLPEIRKRAPHAFIAAFDLTAAMLAVAPTGFACAVMDACALAVASETFDVAVITFMLHHLLDPSAALREARRILRSNGVLGIATWAQFGSYHALDILNEELEDRGARAETTAVTHDLLDTPEKMRTLMMEAGFTGVRTWEEHGFNIMNPEEFLGRHLRLGVTRRKFESLPAGSQQQAVAALRSRLSGMPSEAFDEPMNVVYAIGRVPSAYTAR